MKDHYAYPPRVCIYNDKHTSHVISFPYTINFFHSYFSGAHYYHIDVRTIQGRDKPKNKKILICCVMHTNVYNWHAGLRTKTVKTRIMHVSNVPCLLIKCNINMMKFVNFSNKKRVTTQGTSSYQMYIFSFDYSSIFFVD